MAFASTTEHNWRGKSSDPRYIKFRRTLVAAQQQAAEMKHATPDERAMHIFTTITNAERPEGRRGRVFELNLITMVDKWPSITGKAIDLKTTTMLPSVMERAMAMMNISKQDMALAFGCGLTTATKWMDGRLLIPPIIVAYLMMRGNEVVRAYANGFGFGVLTDVDMAAMAGVSQEAAVAVATGDMAEQERIILTRRKRYSRRSRNNLGMRKSKSQNGLSA